jgi:hypothetical protein
MSARKSIPVQFLDSQLAVSSEFAREKLGYQHKSEAAWHKFWERFRHLNGIRRIPGSSVFSFRALAAAVDVKSQGDHAPRGIRA